MRAAALLGGLALYGLAVGTIVVAAIGVSPWDVLAQGISRQTGLLFGVVTNIVGALVLLLWIPLKQRPGIGTLLNVLIVGSMAQVAIWALPAPTSLVHGVGYFAVGLVSLAVASGIYLAADFGAGPRDGLMTGLTTRLGWPIWLSRFVVEGSVLLIGWLMGGGVGIGTLVFAVAIGPLCHVTIPFFRRRIAPGTLTSTPSREAAR